MTQAVIGASTKADATYWVITETDEAARSVERAQL